MRSSDARLPRAKIVRTERRHAYVESLRATVRRGPIDCRQANSSRQEAIHGGGCASEVVYLPRREGADLGSICVGVTTRDLTASRFPLQPCGGPFEAGCQLGECLEPGGGNAVPGAFAEPACAGGRGRGVEDSSSRPRTRCEETFAHLAMGCGLHATD